MQNSWLDHRSTLCGSAPARARGKFLANLCEHLIFPYVPPPPHFWTPPRASSRPPDLSKSGGKLFSGQFDDIFTRHRIRAEFGPNSGLYPQPRWRLSVTGALVAISSVGRLLHAFNHSPCFITYNKLQNNYKNVQKAIFVKVSQWIDPQTSKQICTPGEICKKIQGKTFDSCQTEDGKWRRWKRDDRSSSSSPS